MGALEATAVPPSRRRRTPDMKLSLAPIRGMLRAIFRVVTLHRFDDNGEGVCGRCGLTYDDGDHLCVFCGGDPDRCDCDY